MMNPVSPVDRQSPDFLKTETSESKESATTASRFHTVLELALARSTELPKMTGALFASRHPEPSAVDPRDISDGYISPEID